MNKRGSDKTKAVIDWITFFPAAMLGSAFAWTIVYSIVQTAFKYAGGLETGASGFFLQLLPNAAFGAAGVYIAARIAPSSKKQVAVGICALMMVIAGLLGYFAAEKMMYEEFIGSGAMVAGAMLVAWRLSG